MMQAVAKTAKMAPLQSKKEGVMLEIDRSYVAVALLWAVVGMLLGLYMGIVADNKLLACRATRRRSFTCCAGRCCGRSASPSS